MKRLPIIFVLLLASGGLSLFGDPEAGAGANPLNRAIWAMVYLMVGFMIYRRSRPFVSAVAVKPGYLILALLAVASYMWSVAPSTTLAHSIALFGATLLAYLIAATVDPRSFLRTAAIALGVLAGSNLIIAAVQSGGNLAALGRFAGSFSHPNVLGRVSALSVLVFICLGQARLMGRVWWLAGAGAAALLLFLSNSMTSTVALFLALGVALVRSQIRGALSSGRLTVMAWAGACVGGPLWLFRWEVAEGLLGMLGRNPTLTGRTYLWQGVWNAVQERRWLGYGYNGFWNGSEHITGRVYDEAGWTTMSAHNGLLEIGLHVGLVGIAIFLITVIPVLVRAFSCDTEMGGGLPRLFLPLLVYLMVLGVTESAYMNRNSIQWVMLVAISVWIRSLHKESRRDETAPLTEEPHEWEAEPARSSRQQMIA